MPKRKPDPRRELSPVRIARKARGWSQERLAREAGVSRNTIDNIERGVTSDENDAPQKVMRILGLEGQSVMPAEFPAAHLPATQTVTEVASLMHNLRGMDQQSYLAALISLAKQRGEPDSVVLHLANGIAEAPQNAGLTWWFARYLDAPRAT